MKIDKIILLDKEPKEEYYELIKDKIDDDIFESVDDQDIRQQKHCDGIIFGKIFYKSKEEKSKEEKLTVLLEIIKGKRLNPEDYIDKPDNTKAWLEKKIQENTYKKYEQHIHHIKKVVKVNGVKSFIVRNIPKEQKNFFIIMCRQHLCECLENKQ